MNDEENTGTINYRICIYIMYTTRFKSQISSQQINLQNIMPTYDRRSMKQKN